MSDRNILKKFVIILYIYRGRQVGGSARSKVCDSSKNAPLRDKDLDTVPTSWIIPNNKKFICYYPPGDDMESMAKKLTEPDVMLWKPHNVTCLYNIGMFYLISLLFLLLILYKN